MPGGRCASGCSRDQAVGRGGRIHKNRSGHDSKDIMENIDGVLGGFNFKIYNIASYYFIRNKFVLLNYYHK